MGIKTISMQDFDAQVQKRGSVGAALNWARENGYELPPANRELPPVEPQGGLKTAEEASTMAADTGEEDTGAEDATGALDYASIDFSKLKDDPGNTLKSLLMAVDAAEQRKAATAKRLYEEGEKRILEKYAGPSQAERLFALSRAMLSPTKTPGFAGFLGNVTGALGESAKAAREAEQTREQKLFELRQQYLTDEAERAAARPKTALEMAKTIATLSKAPAKSSVSPIMVGSDLRPRIRATGAEFKEPPQDQIYALQAYMNDPANTPENKMITRRNFDKTYGYGAAAIYVGD